MEEKLYCKICGKELQGSQRMYCSGKCKQKGHYLEIKNNPNTTFSQNVRAWRRKIKLIEYLGGKCSKCDYNSNIAALEFHHIDASEKEFRLDARKLANSKWEDILKEASKCQLLCCRCHRELHNPEMDINLVNDKIKLFSKKERVRQQHICPICGNETSNTIYCSDRCRQKAKEKRYQSKNYPSKEMILKKYSELKSWEKVAKFYNITRKIVQKIRKNP